MRIKILGKEAYLPESWQQVDLGTYLRIQKWKGDDISELLALITDIDYLRYASGQSLMQIVPHIEFLKKPIKPDYTDLTGTVVVSGKSVEYPTDLNGLPFKYKHYIQQNLDHVIKSDMDNIEAVPFTLAVMLYTATTGQDWTPDSVHVVEEFQEEIEKMTAIEALGLCEYYFILNQEINERWKRSLSTNYSTEELRAGIKDFDKFGTWGMVYNLAGRDVLKFNDIMNVPTSKLFLSLAYNKQIDKYQTEYRRILNKK